MRRRRGPPDKRLDWRDPNMPCIRSGIIDGVKQTAEIKPEHIQQYYAAKVQQFGYPEYKDDPSYWWAKNNLK